MSKSYIKDNDGKTTAVRYTNSNGRTSIDYTYDSTKVICKEGAKVSINDHHKDGTTTSYEPSKNIFFERGRKK